MADTLHIVGGRRLEGEVKLSGAKNAALPVLAATLLMEGECRLRNVPVIEDVRVMCDLLRALGLTVSPLDESGELAIINDGLKTEVAPIELVEKMRASFWVAGPMLARLGRAQVPLPGGCAIGDRPVDFHIAGFRSLGAEVTLDHGYVKAKAARLKGTTIYLDSRFRSVGATINLAMAAALAEGTTTIVNAAREPEVQDFCRFLNAAGARVTGLGGESLEIEGVSSLAGCGHTIISDRIEAGTFLLAGAATRGEVAVAPLPPDHLDLFLSKLAEVGAEVAREENRIRLRLNRRASAVKITTGPYPLFPTDLQSPMAALLCLAEGTSVVQETIFDSRLGYLNELRRMGAEVEAVDQSAVITGVEKLSGARVHAENIRAAAALVVAALAAQGESEITGAQVIARGYSRLPEKWASLGAEIHSSE